MHLHAYLFLLAFLNLGELLSLYVSLILRGVIRGTLIFCDFVAFVDLVRLLGYRPSLHDQILITVLCGIRERKLEKESKIRVLVFLSSVTHPGDP